MYKLGDILKSMKTNHPIVFLQKKDSDYFVGCIITHSTTQKYENNVPFMPNHFETHDSNNNKYEIFYNKSYFVNVELIKKNEWGPFRKVGKLTKDGIEYLKKNLKINSPIEWHKYLRGIISKKF